MIQALNKAIENSFSFKGLYWRFQSIVTRKPFAEVVLLHSLVFDVHQVLLIHKESGLLLHQVQSKLNVSQPGDLVSGMLTAIRDFVRDSFNVKKEEALETIQVGDFSIWVEEGEFALLAVAIRGNAPETLRSQVKTTLEKVEHEFRDEFQQFHDETSPFEKTGYLMESCLQTQLKREKKRVPLLSWLLLTAIIALCFYWGFSTLQENRKWSNYLKKVESIPSVVITGKGKKDGKFFIKGMRDPLSVNPADLLNQCNLEPDAVSNQWSYYHSLEPHYILLRAKKILNPPDTVNLEFKQGVLYAKGSAPNQWIMESNILARGIPGIEVYEDQELIGLDLKEPEIKDREQKDLEIKEFHATIKKIEEQQLEFFVANDQLLPGQEEQVDAAARDIKKLVTFPCFSQVNALRYAGGIRW